ncbi:LptA/OstA family protein [Novosphingobium sp. G106]|uniref:LptA/OstA family protein n=1 Tax=Novosphingobium sp. G106 TaxID=2849500 RepID=UPI001C2D3D07|nr:LptA/OstA family protein [Novosphingobium sp. G106]MBV1689652.1 LptA/OstA family protein [Novosphingobium sp. G106]
MTFRAASKIALGAFFLSGAALVGLQQLGAQAISGHDSNAPVDYAADRIELQDKANRVVLSGNVDITQGDLKMRAARTTVAYTNADALKIQRLDATGGVTVTRGNQSAKGDVAVYDFNRRIITMAGNVALRRGTDTLNGGRLVMDLNTGLSSVDGRPGGSSSALGGASGGGGRVSGSFSVPKRTN